MAKKIQFKKPGSILANFFGFFVLLIIGVGYSAARESADLEAFFPMLVKLAIPFLMVGFVAFFYRAKEIVDGDKQKVVSFAGLLGFNLAGKSYEFGEFSQVKVVHSFVKKNGVTRDLYSVILVREKGDYLLETFYAIDVANQKAKTVAEIMGIPYQ